MPNDNPLHKAAKKGDIEECKKWIEVGDPDEGEDPLPVDCPGAQDRRPLMIAAGQGEEECCKFLLSKGAAVDA
eukprot:gene54069-72261_t